MAFGHHRYASNAEKPDADKLSHDSVGYKIRKTDEGVHHYEHCSNCHNLIHSFSLRCVGVRSPISANGWCTHWEAR